MKLVYPAYFTPLEKSDGYCITFPDLPGCVTQGKDLTESIEMAVDAASGWILDELEDGNPVPKSSKITDIKIENDGEFVNAIVLDMDSYFFAVYIYFGYEAVGAGYKFGFFDVFVFHFLLLYYFSTSHPISFLLEESNDTPILYSFRVSATNGRA